MSSLPQNSKTKIVPALRATPARNAFSLIEVTLAVGLVSFALLSVMAMLPVGLKTFQHSKEITTQAGIFRDLRSQLSGLPFENVPDIDGTSVYYSENGVRLNNSDDAHYRLDLSINAPSFPGADANAVNHIQTVRAQLRYPLSAGEQAMQSSTFSTLIAKQNNDATQ